jgi:hypothetical protein
MGSADDGVVVAKRKTLFDDRPMEISVRVGAGVLLFDADELLRS